MHDIYTIKSIITVPLVSRNACVISMASQVGHVSRISLTLFLSFI